MKKNTVRNILFVILLTVGCIVAHFIIQIDKSARQEKNSAPFVLEIRHSGYIYEGK